MKKTFLIILWVTLTHCLNIALIPDPSVKSKLNTVNILGKRLSLAFNVTIVDFPPFQETYFKNSSVPIAGEIHLQLPSIAKKSVLGLLNFYMGLAKSCQSLNLDSKNFDMVFYDAHLYPCLLPKLANLKTVVLWFTSLDACTGLFGECRPFLQPNFGSIFGLQMDFTQRILNWLNYLLFAFSLNIAEAVSLQMSETPTFRYYNLEHQPVLHQMAWGFEYPSLLPPNFIGTTPFSIDPQMNAGSELVKENTILFSFGSSYPLAVKDWKIALQVFAKYPQINFIVKTDEKTSLPNVQTVKWMAQTNLLAHPNTLGIILHGGVQSILEALYLKKPVVVIPQALDHWDYCSRIREHALGFCLESLSQQGLSKAISGLLYSNFSLSLNKVNAYYREWPEITSIEKFIQDFQPVGQQVQVKPFYLAINLDILFIAAWLATVFCL